MNKIQKKNTLILGVAGGHDANWCLFENGELVGAFEKERFTRIRHDSGYVMDLVEITMDELGYHMEDIDLVVTTESNQKKGEPGLEYVSYKKYQAHDEWVEQSVKIKDKIVPCYSIPHHLSHASYSYYSSNQDESAVIIWDGGGDFYTEDAYTSTSVSLWKSGKLEWIERIGNCDIGSLWHIYSKVIFNNPNAAGKIMGLAATGTPSIVNEFKNYFVKPTRGILSHVKGIKNCWPDEDVPPFSDVKGWEDNNAKDLAYAIQSITNEVGVNIADSVYELTKVKNLALGGGVALNGYLNTEIKNKTRFDNVFVPPSVHDGGLSIGASLFVINHILKLGTKDLKKNDLIFTGLRYSGNIEEFDLKAGCEMYKLNQKEKVMKAVDLISEGKIIAWFEGSSEHGPRALGHRSIVASPCFEDMKDKLNKTIKFREQYRPIAPVVLKSDIRYCTDDIDESPFMMFIVNTKPDFQKQCPSALHYDNTARVQTVELDNPLGLMIEELKTRNLPPVLLNTSFNVRTPIVENPVEAIKTYFDSPIDALFLDDYLILKGN